MDYTKFRDVSYANEDVRFDGGLRSYMIAVYNYMALALALTGFVAFAASLSPSLMYAIFSTPLGFVVALAPLGMIFYMNSRMQTMSVSGAQTSFWVFSALMGLSLSSIFMVYTGASIAKVFFISATAFGALSLYGYSTSRDLSAWGSFLIMGLVGLIVASLANIFFQSPAVEFAVSLIGVLVFAGLTAWDTQKIKDRYFQVGGSSEIATKVAVFGALELYMDFINLFLSLLRLFGQRNGE
jgi:FtsH-binding integral membrane protein